jgi:hypothetical protein
MEGLGELQVNFGGSMEQLGVNALNTATNVAEWALEVITTPGEFLGKLIDSVGYGVGFWD